MSTAAQSAQESKSSSRMGIALLSWGSFALAFVESICVAAVALSGVRVVIGLSSLVSATAAGPAHGFHRNSLRLTFLALGGAGSCLVLLLAWNEERMRRNSSAAWRLQPLTPKQRRSRRLQVVLSVLSLLLIAAEILTHPWFHHEF